MPTRAPRRPAKPTTAPSPAAARQPPQAADPAPLPPCENAWFELRRSPIQGLGAFATRDIPRGTRIIEYIGEKISVAESDRRYPDSHDERHHTFLFTLNSKWIIDAAFGGNESRFINHSCAPNCEAVIERGHIYIDALKRIPAGTELSYDYQYEYLDEYTEEDLRFYECRCGAAECRGTIVAPKPRRRSRKK